MKTYFLDTSIIIEYLRGKTDVVSKINSLDGSLTSSFLCLAELFEGVCGARNKKEAKFVVTNFFSGLSQIYTLDHETAEQFGLLRRQLREKGTLIEDMDIFIAATCLVHNLILVTLNVKHFSRIKSLKLLLRS